MFVAINGFVNLTGAAGTTKTVVKVIATPLTAATAWATSTNLTNNSAGIWDSSL